MVDYSRLIGADDVGTTTLLLEIRRKLMDPMLEKHGGRVVNTAGDSMLMVFSSIVSAARCAWEMQSGVPQFDGGRPENELIRFRMGVNLGDALSDGQDLHGDGVNVAARLQSMCPPGAVCVSRAVRDLIRDRVVNCEFESLGALRLKNIARPTEAFAMRPRAHATRLDRWHRDVAAAFRALRRQRNRAALTAAVLLLLLVAGLPLFERVRTFDPALAAMPDLNVNNAPKISLAVLPFRTGYGDPAQQYIAASVTEDLTTDLSRIEGALIIARSSAATYKGRTLEPRSIGSELGVRYVVEGSAQRIADVIKVNVQLVSTETGTQIWADRFDQTDASLGRGQPEIAQRIATALGARLADSSAPTLRGPINKEALDLYLRAQATMRAATSVVQLREAENLFGRALEIEPDYLDAMCSLALLLGNEQDPLGEPRPGILKTAVELWQKAENINPDDPKVVELRGAMLLWQGRYDEGTQVYRRIVAAEPNNVSAHHQLGAARLWSGDPEGAIPHLREAIRRDPRNPGWGNYMQVGIALVHMHQPEAAIAWLQRAVGETPVGMAKSTLRPLAYLASALALSGKLEQAHRVMAEVTRLAPFWTARLWDQRQEGTSPLAKQLQYATTGLIAAGLRTSVPEDADWGIVSDGSLHEDAIGKTPTTVPGASIISTAELQRMIVGPRRPIILDMNASGGRTLPGGIIIGDAIRAFSGGSLDDAVQDHLRRRMLALSSGDLTVPIVTVSWNTERWIARNVALRLVALNYTSVYWYRGGRELWEELGLPESDADNIPLSPTAP